MDFHALNEAQTYGMREDQRSVIVEGLLPDQLYSFRIRSINDYGKGNEASVGSGKCGWNCLPCFQNVKGES